MKISHSQYFLGAGASQSGGIPLAGEIIEQILNDYSKSPLLEDLPTNDRINANFIKCSYVCSKNEMNCLKTILMTRSKLQIRFLLQLRNFI